MFTIIPAVNDKQTQSYDIVIVEQQKPDLSKP